MKIEEKEMLLVQLSEECSEVIQAICKLQRFGPHKSISATHDSNLTTVWAEMNDVFALIQMVRKAWDLPTVGEYNMEKVKIKKVNTYMDISRKCGTVV